MNEYSFIYIVIESNPRMHLCIMQPTVKFDIMSSFDQRKPDQGLNMNL